MASRVRGAGVAIVAGVFGMVSSAAGEPVESLAIVVGVVDHAQLPPRVLARGRSEAARIYRSAGIELVWSDAPDFSVPQMVVTIVCKPTGASLSVPERLAVKSADRRILGVSPGNKERRDLVAWAFYERILDVATMHGIDPGLLLGHVIAHELGHLLLPFDAHSQSGLMRASWDKTQATECRICESEVQPR